MSMPGHHAAQRLDVVAVDLALEQRALAEPGARRHAGEGDREADELSLLIFSSPSSTPNQ